MKSTAKVQVRIDFKILPLRLDEKNSSEIFNWKVTQWVECDEGFKCNAKVKERPMSMIYEFTKVWGVICLWFFFLFPEILKISPET